MEVIIPVRAKEMYVEVERQDKYGNRKPAKVKQNVTISAGTYSGKEMEQMAAQQAHDLGISEDRIKIETYAKGEAPVEVNPRHRGHGKRWSKLPDDVTETTVKPTETRVRTVFQGVDLPKTPEELELYLADFEARKAALRASARH